MEPTVILCVFFAVLVTVISDCPNGWTTFDGSCYRLYRNGTKWPLALFDCETKDAYLATLNTTTKIQNIHALMQELNGKDGDRIWIGMTDAQMEDNWVWEYTGKQVTHFDWASGEPNDSKNNDTQDCVMLYGHKGFKWADDRCTSSFSYMCEQPESAN